MRGRMMFAAALALFACAVCFAQGGNFDSLLRSGDGLADAGKWAEAAKVYRLATELNPKSAEAFLRLADALMGAGDWREAEAAYKQSIRLDEGNAEAHYALGEAYNDMGQHGDAFKPLVRAIQLAPAHAEAHHGIGYAYLHTDQYDKALPFLKSALRLKPDYAEAHRALALTYARLGNAASAEEHRRRLAALDPAASKQLERELREGGLKPSALPAGAGAAAGREAAPAPARRGHRRGSRAADEHAREAAAPKAAPTPAAPARGAPADPAFELAFWDTIKNSTDPEDFRAYLRKYPDGVFADLARRRAAPKSAASASTEPTLASARPPTSKGPASNPPRPPANTSAAAATAARPAGGTPAGAAALAGLGASFKGLRPGTSTRAEVESALGPPVKGEGGAMVEYAAAPPARRVFAEYRADSHIVKQIVLYLEGAPARSALAERLKLPARADATKTDAKGRLAEYFGGPPVVMLTHESADPSSPVFSLAYISPEIFEKAAGRPAPGHERPRRQQTAASPAAAAQPSGPTYDGLVERANAAWFGANDAQGALRLAQQAVTLDPKRAEAFQLLGIVQLYGNKDFGAATQAMRAAVERGGAAGFGVTHDHSGTFTSSCQGTLWVSRAGVSFSSPEASHSFQITAAQVREAKPNNFFGVGQGAFHIKFEPEPGKTKNYNFTAGSPQHTSLILSLMPAR